MSEAQTDKDLREKYSTVYRDTQDFLAMVESNSPICRSVLNDIRRGKTEVALNKKYILKAIDEKWVSAIERVMPALDTVIRLPSRTIEEREDVMPIELSRNITSRSLMDLGQHSDYINKVEGDMVIPSKILNVFYEETDKTYENKFVNTLLNRLYIFLDKRYSVLKTNKNDEISASMEISADFKNEKAHGKVRLSVEVTEDAAKADSMPEIPQDYDATLFGRVEKLYRIVMAYIKSPFAISMGKEYIRPPVMRTNAITKNKYLMQCLELWQFIESYDKAGYEMLISETAEQPQGEYLEQLYAMLALNYANFCHNVDCIVNDAQTLSARDSEDVISPRIVTEIKPYDSDDYTVFDSRYMKMVPVSAIGSRRKLSDDEIAIKLALSTAIAAMDRIGKSGIDYDHLTDTELEDDFTEAEIGAQTGEMAEIPQDIVTYKRSHESRIIQADEKIKKYYNEILHEISGYPVKRKLSWNYDNFTYRSKAILRLRFSGKSIVLNLAMDEGDIAAFRFSVKLSGKTSLRAVPAEYRINNEFSLRRSLLLINALMDKLQLPKSDAYDNQFTAEYPAETDEMLEERGLIRKMFVNQIGFGKNKFGKKA